MTQEDTQIRSCEMWDLLCLEFDLHEGLLLLRFWTIFFILSLWNHKRSWNCHTEGRHVIAAVTATESESCKLTSAEWNYDVGNRELLAVTVALEEQRNWLGAEQTFIVWTDHKNLICKARRLNSRQTRWALFFNRFNFTLSYCPGHQIDLSRLYDPDPAPKEHKQIPPPSWEAGAEQMILGSHVPRIIRLCNHRLLTGHTRHYSLVTREERG